MNDKNKGLFVKRGYLQVKLKEGLPAGICFAFFCPIRLFHCWWLYRFIHSWL